MSDMGIDIHPEDEIFYNSQYKEAFPKYAENAHCGKHRSRAVNQLQKLPSSNFSLAAMALESGQSSFNAYDSSADV